MATKTFTPSMLRGAGTCGVPEIPVGSSYENTYSMNFDGVDEYITCGNVLDKGVSDAFSISFWIKISAPRANNSPLGKLEYLGSTPGYAGYKFRINNELYFSLSTDGHFSHYISVRAGNNTDTYWGANFINVWHHVVGTYDGSNTADGMSIYIDSYDVTEARTKVGTGNSNNSGPLTFGAASGSFQNFKGDLDEIAIFNYELSQAQVDTIYNGTPPSGGGTGAPWNDGTGEPADLTSLSPAGWWRMGDKGEWNGSAWVLTDQGSGGNNGTSENMEEGDRNADVPPT